MVDSTNKVTPTPAGSEPTGVGISIVQRGNLKALERSLRKQWRLGQNIVLCWSADERGLLVIFVPHYFLGNYCASGGAGSQESQANEVFIRDLISGQRRKSRHQLFAVAKRLDVAPTFIRLDTALAEAANVLESVEQLIKRYGISFVNSRAVLLFDISEFSLHTPFEQASQLNSLSYSLNSAYNKLLAQGIDINFARTTTGDGYYVWNRDIRLNTNQELFYFMLLVVADNARAQAASRGRTVPVIRTAYHIGSHYELYQAEGVNPTVFSYIVGDVTIELARLVELAEPNQIFVGDFRLSPGDDPSADQASTGVATPAFVSHCADHLDTINGVQLGGKIIREMRCNLSESMQESGELAPRRFTITDKHGLSRDAYNLEAQLQLDDERIKIGLDPDRMPASRKVDTPHVEIKRTRTKQERFDELAAMLRNRADK